MSEEPEQAVESSPSHESFGTWLRQQREMREIDLQEIADRTKISMRYLQAMEDDRFDRLPGSVFARGFLREYARYVGLNPDEVVNFYLQTRDEAGEGADSDELIGDKPTSPRFRILLGLAVFLALASAVAYFLYHRAPEGPINPLDRDRAASAEAPAPPPVPEESIPEPETEEEVENASDAPLNVVLDFTGDCWVDVRIDDRESITRAFIQGESLQVEADQKVELVTLGNGGGVSVRVNGVPFSLDAAPGEVVKNRVIDLETARRLAGRR
jgi:cytoskeleton protein RodZ